MAVEIERKFVVCSDGWQSAAKETSHIRQAYLAKTKAVSMRIRIRNDEHAALTIKSAKRQMAREEFEYAIPLEDAEKLMTMCRGSAIEKVRHTVHVGDSIWEIDVFSGDNAGLVVAEIELGDAAENFERPSWLGAEVTGDPCHHNSELALRPYRE